MAVRPRAAWVRAASGAILLSWLPCVPVGVCVAMPSAASAHGCCPRQRTLTVSAAPRECWLQSPVPLPVVPLPSAPGASAPVDFHSHVPTQVAALYTPRPATFSDLAVVLRI